MADRWGWLHAAATAAASGCDAPDAREAVRARVVGGVAVAVARRCEVRLPELPLLSAWGSPALVAVPDGLAADRWLIGTSLEVLLGTGERQRRGAHFTPRAVAEAVTGLALDGLALDRHTTVCDPAAGGGAFLLAAAEALHGAGIPKEVAVRNLSGVDVDPLAAAVTEAGLCLWAGGRAAADVRIADALVCPAEAWGALMVVVGNPPFLGQLRSATARSPDRSGLPPDLAAIAGPYTDTSSLFAALATSIVAPGGRVALVLPRSFLVARDAGAARVATLGSAVLEHVWLPVERLFGASVDVCVPVWQRRSTRTGGDGVGCATASTASSAGATVSRSVGVPAVPAPALSVALGSTAGSWSQLLAGLDDEPGAPSVDGLRTAGVLGDHCTATAGFRDQYYGLIPFVVDDPDGLLDDDGHAPLVTSGLIDPAVSAWGRRTTRYAGRRWEAPRVDVGAVEEAGGFLARWAAAKRIPKLLVAAQTRTIEAVADVDGTWLPSTPVATVVPEEEMQWHVLAVLLSPVAAAWALFHQRGSGLSPGAVRLPPSALRAIPTPADRVRWDAAAAEVREASTTSDPMCRSARLTSAARAMCIAYGTDPEPAVEWWRTRQPVASSASRRGGAALHPLRRLH